MTLEKKYIPTRIELYSMIIDIMKIGCNSETCQKLDLLKRNIEKGFDSAETNSINIFGKNLFIYTHKQYLEMYYAMNEGLG